METLEQSSPASFKKNDRRILNGWVMFDWANSAFALVITAAIFPAYFLEVTDEVIHFLGMEISNSSLFAFAVSGAYILIAIVSPWLSGIADSGGKKMFFLKFFTTFGAIGCLSLLWFSGMTTLWLGTIGFIMAMIGFAGGLVFYNSYLPEIATEDMYDKVSARGFAFGYLGSVLLLLINLAMLIKPEWFGLPDEGTLSYRLALGMVGLWWIGFAQISFRRLPKDIKKGSDKMSTLAKQGWAEIKKVWYDLSEQTQLKRFLFCFFCYSMGVQTVLYLAATFAKKELAFATNDLIGIVLILQIVGIGGAFLFAHISKLKGNVFSLAVMLIIWAGICVAAYLVQTNSGFYLISACVGLVMGGIQALSRSTYSKLLPEDTEDTTSYFSFYDVLEKVAIVLGTFIFGLAEFLTGNIRYSVLVLSVFFIISLFALRGLKVDKSVVG